VQLDYADTEVRLSVVNHLNGAAVTDRKPGLAGGYGLTGMRERLRLLNGTLLVGPRENEWAVTAELPLPAAAAEDVTTR
jgi:signal transduction histidine kinase